MSKGVAHDPVCENQTTAKVSRPLMVTSVNVAMDPVCRQWTGDQTAVPDLPPTN